MKIHWKLKQITRSHNVRHEFIYSIHRELISHSVVLHHGVELNQDVLKNDQFTTSTKKLWLLFINKYHEFQLDTFSISEQNQIEFLKNYLQFLFLNEANMGDGHESVFNSHISMHICRMVQKLLFYFFCIIIITSFLYKQLDLHF